MKKTLSLTILAVMLTLGTKGAWADGSFPTAMTDGTYGPAGSVTPNDNTNGPEIYQAINNLLANSLTPQPTYSNNAQVDPLEYTGSTSTWEQTGTGGYAFIGLGAGASNTLGVYSVATPGSPTNVFGQSFSGNVVTGTGTSSSPYIGIGSSAVTPAGQFGFVLNSNNPYTSTISNWYSNTGFNVDGMDHMIVYNLTALEGATIYVQAPGGGTVSEVTLQDPYLLAFEDLPETNNVTGAPSDVDYNDYLVLVDGIAPVPEPMTVALFAFGLLAMAGFALRRKLAFVA
jgi:hypothetical protein